jgi:hypothetical protein
MLLLKVDVVQLSVYKVGSLVSCDIYVEGFVIVTAS